MKTVLLYLICKVRSAFRFSRNSFQINPENQLKITGGANFNDFELTPLKKIFVLIALNKDIEINSNLIALNTI
jgi:hypothetical protein